MDYPVSSMRMSYSQFALLNLMDMGSLLGTMLGTILNYQRAPMSTLNGPLVWIILTVAYIIFQPLQSA